MLENALPPLRIRHVRQIVFVKSRRFFHLFFGLIEEEYAF